MTYSSFSCDWPVGGAGGAKNAAAAAAGSRSSATVSVEDAVSFVQMVKEAFKEQPDKYHLFIRLMDDFKNHRVSVAEVASTAKALFQDAPDLALGFNVFMPKSHWIQVGLDDVAACFIRDVSLDDDDYDGGGH